MTTPEPMTALERLAEQVKQLAVATANYNVAAEILELQEALRPSPWKEVAQVREAGEPCEWRALYSHGDLISVYRFNGASTDCWYKSESLPYQLANGKALGFKDGRDITHAEAIALIPAIAKDCPLETLPAPAKGEPIEPAEWWRDEADRLRTKLAEETHRGNLLKAEAERLRKELSESKRASVPEGYFRGVDVWYRKATTGDAWDSIRVLSLVPCPPPPGAAS